MAKSFGLDRDDAHDLVQDMYLRLHQYVDNPEKLEYGDDDVNTFFVYITLRNMYLREMTQRARIKFVSIEEFDDKEEIYNIESDQALTLLLEAVNGEVSKWDWYDNKLFTIYHNVDEQWEQARFVCYNESFTYPYRVVGVNEEVPSTIDDTSGFIYCK